MSYLYAGTIRDTRGNALIGVGLTVYTDAGGTTPASLTNSGGTPIANPLSADSRGRVEVYCTAPTLWYKVTGDTAVMRFLRFCDLVQGTITGPYLNVMDFGAHGNGSDDDSAHCQAAIDAAANGGTVVFPAGTYLLDSASLVLPPGCAERLTLSGYGATLKTTATSVSAINFVTGTSTDHAVFSNLTIEGFAIDADNLAAPAGSACVVGGCDDNHVANSRKSFEHIVIRDLKIINVPTGTGADIWFGISISTIHGDVDEATQDHITDIVIERCRVEGGRAGINISAGSGSGGDAPDPPHIINVVVDDVTIRDCYHDVGLNHSAFLACSNFHIGSLGIGGKALISNCIGISSGDVGVEINAFDNGVVENCTMIDCYHGYYHNAYGYPLHQGAQGITFRNCQAVYHDYAHTAGMTGFQIDDTQDYHDGSVTIRDCSYYSDVAWFNTPMGVYLNAWTGTGKFTVDGFTYEVKDFSEDSDHFMGAIWLQPDAAHSVIRNVAIKITGTIVGTPATSSICGVRAHGASHIVDIDGVVIDFDVTNAKAGSMRGVTFYSASTSHVGGSLRNVYIKNLIGHADAWGIHMGGSANVSLDPHLFVESCDLRATADLRGILYNDTSGHLITIRDCLFNAAHPTWPFWAATWESWTPGASPATYTNTDGMAETLVVSGGTVTKIEVLGKGGAFLDTFLTAGMFDLEPGHQLRVTYSSAPAVAKILRP